MHGVVPGELVSRGVLGREVWLFLIATTNIRTEACSSYGRKLDGSPGQKLAFVAACVRTLMSGRRIPRDEARTGRNQGSRACLRVCRRLQVMINCTCISKAFV